MKLFSQKSCLDTVLFGLKKRWGFSNYVPWAKYSLNKVRKSNIVFFVTSDTEFGTKLEFTVLK